MIAARLFAAGAAVAFLAACSSDGILPPEPEIPTAVVRFVNAVPDTLPFDLRFVDIVQNSPTFSVAFRGVTPYQQVTAGTRQVRVFLSSTNPAIASQVIFDQPMTFEEGRTYTLIAQGFSRAGQAPAAQLRMVEDVTTAPAAGQIGYRVFHLGAGVGAIDGYLNNAASAGALPAVSGTPAASNVAFGAASAYTTVSASGASESLFLRVAAAGTTTPVLATVTAPVGVAGTPTANPVPGSRIAGTVLTGFVFGPSVAGSSAPSFTSAGGVVVFDRRPPSTAP